MYMASTGSTGEAPPSFKVGASPVSTLRVGGLFTGLATLTGESMRVRPSRRGEARPDWRGDSLRAGEGRRGGRRGRVDRGART